MNKCDECIYARKFLIGDNATFVCVLPRSYEMRCVKGEPNIAKKICIEEVEHQCVKE